MGEQQHTPERFSSPELTQARALMALFEKMHSVVSRFEGTSFATKAEATQALEALMSKGNDYLFQLDDALYVDLHLSGAGVEIPNYTIEAPEGPDLSVRISVPKDKKFRELELFESIPARMREVVGHIVETEQGQFKPVILLKMQMGETFDASISVEQYNAGKIVGISISRTAFVQLNGQAHITSDLIEEQALQVQRTAYIEEHAGSPAVAGELTEALDALTTEMSEKDGTIPIPIKKVEIFKKLGSIGYDRAIESEATSMVVSRTILYRLGVSRPMTVAFIAGTSGHDLEHEVTGELLEVMMPMSEDDPVTPAIVLERRVESTDRNEMVQIPFNRISAVRF